VALIRQIADREAAERRKPQSNGAEGSRMNQQAAAIIIAGALIATAIALTNIGNCAWPPANPTPCF
jgi:hypothetical protein